MNELNEVSRKRMREDIAWLQKLGNRRDITPEMRVLIKQTSEKQLAELKTLMDP